LIIVYISRAHHINK